MGPPREHGGKNPHASRSSFESLLQWGRRVNTAERVRRANWDYSVLQLQWGRRVNTAESRRCATYCARLVVASMGPPREHGGKFARATSAGPVARASMGPPREHGGKAPARLVLNVRLARFNGAAA